MINVILIITPRYDDGCLAFGPFQTLELAQTEMLLRSNGDRALLGDEHLSELESDFSTETSRNIYNITTLNPVVDSYQFDGENWILNKSSILTEPKS